MENKRPFILISNDDGYAAKGIHSLIEMIRDMADILVCAKRFRLCLLSNRSFSVDLSSTRARFGNLVM